MVFFINTDINDKKNITNSLKGIYGLGPNRIKQICLKLGFKTKLTFKQIPPEIKAQLKRHIETNYTTGEALRKETLKNEKVFKSFRCFKGSRIKARLPRRGQRTHTNAKTTRKKK
jgi:small subunit ribosomal protein S13